MNRLRVLMVDHPLRLQIHLSRLSQKPGTPQFWTAGDPKIPERTPLLRIDRMAYAIDGRPVEWRISLVHLDGAHYLARLRLPDDRRLRLRRAADIEFDYCSPKEQRVIVRPNRRFTSGQSEHQYILSSPKGR